MKAIQKKYRTFFGYSITLCASTLLLIFLTQKGIPLRELPLVLTPESSSTAGLEDEIETISASIHSEKIAQSNISQPHSIRRSSQAEWIENKGQLSDINGRAVPHVLYYGNTEGGSVFLRDKGISLVPVSYENLTATAELTDSAYVAGHRLDVDLVHGNDDIQIEKQSPLSSCKNFYTANHPEGLTQVHSYESIVYRNVYDNVDMIFYAPTLGKFKYDFIVNPGASPATIGLQYSGADSVNIFNGILSAYLSNGIVREWMPKVYQLIDGREVLVHGEFYKANGIVKIRVSNYNTSHALIIDPWVTYFGGGGPDYGLSVITDPSGNVLFTGKSSSLDFPASTGAFQVALASDFDSYVVKMNASGVPLWSTYYGGTSAEDGGKCIATDASGNVYFTGHTASANFPVSAGAYQTTFGGGFNDNFLVKLSPTGTRLWGTFFGGERHGTSNAVCVDSSNNVIIAGLTRSLSFPITAGAYASTGTGQDGFIAKFTSAGALTWSTYYNYTEFKGVTTNSVGEIIVSGYAGATTSTTAGSYKPVSVGGDALIAKFSPTGTRMWATCFGGSGSEGANGITVDPDDNILLTGSTLSTDLYTSASAFQTTLGGLNDAFLVKFNTAGFPLWGTYIGGSGNEEAFGVAVDNTTGSVYVAGDTYSNDFPFTDCAYQKAIGGGSEDNYIAKFDKNGFRICSGYIGGTGHDEMDFSYPLAVRGANVYIVAEANGGYPVTPDSHQPVLAGGQDAIVANLCGNSCSVENISLNFSASKTSICRWEPINLTLAPAFLCDTAGATFRWYFPGATPASSNLKNPTGIFYTSSGTYPIHLSVTGGCGKDSIGKLAYIVVGGCSLPINLISFSGNKSDDGNLLDWTFSGSSLSKEDFVVERAGDDGQFQVLSAISVRSLSTGSISSGHFLDPDPNTTVNFYRLQYQNNSGDLVYSNTIALDNYDNAQLRIAPNPSSGMIELIHPFDKNSTEALTYSIVNNEGKEMLHGTLRHEQRQIDLSAFTNGVYTIRVRKASWEKEIIRKLVLWK